MACYVRDAGRQPGARALLRWGSHRYVVNWIADAANLARRFPPLRGGPVDGLLEDLAQRPDTLQYLYSTYREIVTATRFLRGAYERNGFSNPMRSIHFGVDIDRREKPARASGHRPVIGYIGQIARHKGVDILIDAFNRLPANSAELHIYGASDQEPHYVARLHASIGSAAVSFRGSFAKERMREVMDSIDLLVIPSRWYENSPLVLLNALATHTPVVVSDVEGMTEFIEPERNGYAFERGSVDDLDRVLRGLIRDREALERLSMNTHYERTPRVMAEETLAIY
jgi:glycosyltransferase involved in cell wall biosynthesis